MYKVFEKIRSTGLWKLLAYLITACLTLYSIYDSLLKNKSPDYSIDILSNYDVLDIKENISDLKIFVGDIDLNSVQKNLSIIVINVKNAGGATIEKGSYDLQSAPTIQLIDGKILKAERTDASNQYLLQGNLAPQLLNNSIVLPPLILDPHDYVTLKVLVIHDQNRKPNIKTAGKIAGVKNFNITDVSQKSEDPNFFKGVINGSFWTHFTRFFLYIFLLGSTMFFWGLIYDLVVRKADRKKKASVIRSFLTHSKRLENIDDPYFVAYKKHGSYALLMMKEIICNEAFLTNALNKTLGNYELAELMDTKNDKLEHFLYSPRIEGITMILPALRSSVDDKNIVRAERLELLNQFLDFIKIKEC